jgi:protein-tyrosine phosphatase
MINAYIPIIAHVERYLCLVEEPIRLQKLIDVGAYVQINISSIIGGITNKRARFCKKLIKEDMVHFIGTDAHSEEHRAPFMKEGIAIITKKFGTETAEILGIKNPTLLLDNKYL